MVSDVICYPARTVELLSEWTGTRLAGSLVVTTKFQGTAPEWDAVDEAAAAVRERGYDFRAKHFFNNKNLYYHLPDSSVCQPDA